MINKNSKDKKYIIHNRSKERKNLLKIFLTFKKKLKFPTT